MKKTALLALSLATLLTLSLAGCAGKQTGSNMADAQPSVYPEEGMEDAVDRMGDGIRDTLDDIGDAARDMGRDATDTIQGR